VVPAGRYRRGSVSHSWSETTIVSDNATALSASPPERLYTPVDELLTAEQQKQLRAAAAAASPLSDDGPYSRTNVFTADYSDTRQLQIINYLLASFVVVVFVCGCVCRRKNSTRNQSNSATAASNFLFQFFSFLPVGRSKPHLTSTSWAAKSLPQAGY